ncbi:unnamed protein product [Spirodela intermedia]|uniref:DNA 3'-5' helicase n=1 Tax=Spirodela intermedia TaxID=51605 RepID=A0A7I8JHY8_SPIIN|nr:unnamed protein product [Spirodela intermedia]CAA6669779.1 unnamed protein product [Spirodela intermedia]
MDDENAVPHPRQHWQQFFVSDDRRTRIPDSFRASKAFVACKRPRDFAPVNSSRFDDSRSLPLSELCLNAFSHPVAHRAPTCVSQECATLGAFVGSVKQEVDNQAFEASVPPPRVSDEEFDEAVLKEIDAICEQRSSAKRERLTSFGSLPSSHCLTLTHHERPPDDENDSDSSRMQQIEEERENSAQDVATGDGSVPQAYSEYLESLNDRQREAAYSDISIPLMIVAGPGSGKTSTMVGRVLTLLKEGIRPTNILAMTFTTAAASEMRDRIAKVTGKAIAKELAISTFHSFCLQLCRSHAEKLCRTPAFLIYGHGQQRRAVIESLRVLENEKRDKSGNNCGIMDAVSFKKMSKKWQNLGNSLTCLQFVHLFQAKACGRTPEICQKMGDDMGAKVLQNYENILSSCNALDYHDFISCSVKLLSEFPEVYKSCQDKWKAIVVDEFQDTSSMQYSLLRVLASHNCLTIIGDEDQSIFSFNGADVCGFDSFRRDFPGYKEVRLCKNYRSTRCIVEAASFLIRNNIKRCQQKEVVTENSSGCKCAFVIDKVLEMTSDISVSKCSFNNIAILYRRQVTGRVFQMSFRDRKIPFNNHGVAFYRKKVTRAIIAILRTTLPGCGDGPFRQAFKALFACDKEEKKKIIQYVEKIASARNCAFISAANDIFGAKISGTFKRAQLTQGRKVLSSLGMLSKLVFQELSISSVISSAANLLPQRYLLEQRAVIDVDSGKYLNEDHDLRSVIQYLLDDVAEFQSTYFDFDKCEKVAAEENGCRNTLSAFLDHISLRETENFRTLRCENQNSITLTTIHQSKGLEWDTVFIVKANESEIPLSNELSTFNEECGTNIEEERRLMYVAMTRARKKLYVLYVLMDSNRMLLQPSRFLREIPVHLTEGQEVVNEETLPRESVESTVKPASSPSKCQPFSEVTGNPSLCFQRPEDIDYGMKESAQACLGNNFLKRYRPFFISSMAKKQAFQVPRRLIDKVGFVIDERLRSKTTRNKDLLRTLKASLSDDEAFQYAQYVLRWEKIPLEKRAHLMREKQEHFQKQRIENAMNSSGPSAKQINFLQSLGCTIVPTSRLHASRLIEQYKSL